MSFLDHYISAPSRRQSTKPVATKFSTVHLRVHSDIYELLKHEADENGISSPATLEFILAARYKERLQTQDRVRQELGDPDSQAE